MRVGFVYFKDPLRDLDGMDTIRWLELSRDLSELGHEVDMITEWGEERTISARLHVRHIRRVRWDDYDVIKTTHHTDICAIPEHPFLICRIGRVVDETQPARVASHREELLEAQAIAARKAKWISLMSEDNLACWQERYPAGAPGVIVPNGCPSTIPEIGPSPYRTCGKRALYLGSLTSSRFVEILNTLGRILKDFGVEVHHVGRTQLDLYGETGEQLDPEHVISHGPVMEPDSWNYLFHANVGLMIARGMCTFDNEISKVYYYLRAGVPTITEELISTNNVVQETGWGEIVKYGDVASMASAVVRWLDAPRERRLAIGQRVAEKHSWRNRAAILHQLFPEA